MIQLEFLGGGILEKAARKVKPRETAQPEKANGLQAKDQQFASFFDRAEQVEILEKSYSHGQQMSHPILDNGRMKNRSNRTDTELRKQTEGLTANQVRLLASIYAGLAERLRQETAADDLGKWKERNDDSRN